MPSPISDFKDSNVARHCCKYCVFFKWEMGTEWNETIAASGRKAFWDLKESAIRLMYSGLSKYDLLNSSPSPNSSAADAASANALDVVE